MKKIVAIFALTFACLAPPASADATSLYWNVDINGILTSSTFVFSPTYPFNDPSNPDGYFPPYTLICSSNCGTFEFQSMTTGVFDQEYLNIGGSETINLHDENNIASGGEETVSSTCMDDCPTGYSGVIDVSNFNPANGRTSVYGPYPGSGNVYADYEA